MTRMSRQYRRMSLGGRKLMGWVSGVALVSSLQNLTVLSASAVSSRVPDMSKPAAKMPDSLSSDPGCTIVCPCWKLLPLFQSQNLRHEIPPVSELTLF